MTKPWLKLVKRFVEFSASSLLGTIVDTVVLWVLSKWVFSSYVGQYIVSPMISFECAAVANFAVAYFFIWKDRVWRLQPLLYRSVSGQDGFPAIDPENVPLECRVVQPAGIVRVRRT